MGLPCAEELPATERPGRVSTEVGEEALVLPTVTVARARVGDGTEFVLARRGDEWTVRAGARLLMSNRTHASEETLAEQALARVAKPTQVLVGGLGFGFTLRAVLDRVPSKAQVVVSELVPELVAWNREHVGGLAGHPLEDPRTEVMVGDVFDHILQVPTAFDVILLDVDNGPVALSQGTNQRLYSERGIRGCFRALRPGGVLAVWSLEPNLRYQRALEKARFKVQVLRVAAFKTGRARHAIFLATPMPNSG